MALAAAQERRSAERETFTYSGRNYPSAHETSFEHRKHTKEHDRSVAYETHSRREQNEFQHVGGSSSYRRDWHDGTPTKERDWHEENTSKDMYERSTERHPSSRKDWNETNPKWESRKNTSWQQESENNWNNRYKEDSWSEQNPQSSSHHNRSIIDKSNEHNSANSSLSKPIVGMNRRWNSWRGRGRGVNHHNDFRRTHHHTEILEERGEIYRRHINPQGVNGIKKYYT